MGDTFVKGIKVGIIGTGTLGTAMAIKLSRAGLKVVAGSSRRGISSRRLEGRIEGFKAVSNQEVVDLSDLVFITTPDGVIGEVASSLKWGEGKMAVHMSGSLSSEALLPAKEMGAKVGVLHPIQSFSSPEEALNNLPGSFFSIEGEIKDVLYKIVELLGGRAIEISPDDKPLYHISCVMVSNYFVALVDKATSIWERFGVKREEALDFLLPLIKGTLRNMERLGIPVCLTGPIERGDRGTIELHVKKIRESYPELLPLYRELGLITISVALRKGRIDDKKASEIKEVLEVRG